MRISLLTFEFLLPGCSSLKEKRQRLRGMKDKFGRIPNLAVSETGFHNEHMKAQWSFVALAQDAASIDKLLSQVENYAESQLDAVITFCQRQQL